MSAVAVVGPFIVVEQRNGCAFPYNAFVCNDERDFVDRINASAIKTGIIEDLRTVDACVAWLDERHAQRTFIVSEAEYRERGTISVMIERAAHRLGWDV